MITVLKKLLRLVNPGGGIKLAALILLMAVTALAQSAGIASVMPFLAVLGEPEIIRSNTVLAFLYDYLQFESDERFLFSLGVLSFAVFLTGTALTVTTQWAMTMFASWQQYHLSRRLMQDYLLRPYEFYLSRNSSDLAKVVLNETSQVIAGALTPAMRLLSYSLLALSIIGLLIVIAPMLAFSVAGALGTIYGLIFFVSKRWLSAVGSERVVANRERYISASEAFVGAKEIRLLGREKSYLDRFQLPSKRLANINAKANLLNQLPQYAIEAIAFGGILLLVLFLMAEKSSLAGVLPILGVYGLAGKQLIPAFQKIFTTFATIRLSMATVESVLQDLQKLEAGVGQELSDIEAERLSPKVALSIRELSYRYQGSSTDALANISLDIPVNSTVGFVGPSGSGKSTLMDILLGLLTPIEGRLEVDAVKIDQQNVRNWQASIGYVPQHIFLADQSMAANIALGVHPSKVDYEAVTRVAKLANLHDFVESELPDGYDTMIGERGVRLSGGQRQRIGIARALYRDPPVLVFDEATSALDNATERAVMEAIDSLAGSKTIILVAHRLTTVQSCDTIFLLSSGRIIENGRWDELNQEGTHFAAMASG